MSRTQWQLKPNPTLDEIRDRAAQIRSEPKIKKIRRRDGLTDSAIYEIILQPSARNDAMLAEKYDKSEGYIRSVRNGHRPHESAVAHRALQAKGRLRTRVAQLYRDELDRLKTVEVDVIPPKQ